MENRKVRLNQHTNLLELEEHMYPLVDVDTPNVFRNMLGQFTALLAGEGMNISLMANKSKKEYAYTMIDVESEVSGQIAKALEAVEGVLKVRVIV